MCHKRVDAVVVDFVPGDVNGDCLFNILMC